MVVLWNVIAGGHDPFVIACDSLHPAYDQAMNNLANLLKEKQDYPEAESLLQKAVSIRPSFAAAWMNLGIVQAALHKVTDAETSYQMALKHRRKYPDCYYNLGNLVNSLRVENWICSFVSLQVYFAE